MVIQTYLRDIIDNHDFEFVAVRLKELAKVLRLALRAHRPSYGEALLEVCLDDPDGNIAVRTSDKNLS